MKVTYNWLKDFVEINISPQALAEKLTMAGLEVSSLQEQGEDFVFEIEVTSNRPDCLSIIGIAREIAAITNSKLKIQSLRVNFKKQKKDTTFKIEIKDRKGSSYYTAKIIKDVKVELSPGWLKRRLELVGCRSVNNIVDITNYILFEYGEPLHAFDLDKLSKNSIVVRRAKNNEKITTIDDQERILDPDILVIADKEKAIAIAGIMGSKDTEVTEATKDILLEAAVFDPIVVRRARQKLGIQSESAYRFERGVNSQIVNDASFMATQLIQKISGGRFVLAKDCGLAKKDKKHIKLEVSSAQKALGINIKASEIKVILNNLGFGLKEKRSSLFLVTVPSFRPDVNLEVDLIEEIARISGYERIPKTLPKIIPQITAGSSKNLVTLIKHILVSLGLNEVITYSLIDRNLLNGAGADENFSPVEILNPLNKEQEILRPTVIPSLANCVANNLNQKQGLIKVFEIAKVFSKSAGQLKEEPVLGIALCGTHSLLLEQGLIKEELSLLHLKGVLELLFKRLGLKGYNFNSKFTSSAIAVYAHREKIGIMARLQKNSLKKFDIKNKDVFVAELFLEKLFPYVELSKRFVSLPKYPGISRDLSLILKEEVLLADMLKAMEEKGRPLLQDIKIVDYYKGKQIPPGFRGLTISCLYRSEERTLTEEEINPLHSLVSFMLADKFGAQIRKA